MKKAALALILCLISFPIYAEDHLLPIDLGIAYARDTWGKQWLNTLGKDDQILVEFDVFRAFGGASYLALIGSADHKTYTLHYLEDSHSLYDLRKVPVSKDFATYLDEKVGSIIRRDTYYNPTAPDSPGIIDGNQYFFRSDFVAGQAYAGATGDIPGQLIKMFKTLMELAKTADTDANKRQVLMDQCRAQLDAINPPIPASSATTSPSLPNKG